TAAKTSKQLKFTVQRGSRGEQPIPGGFASVVGVNIYLAETDNFIMEWHEMGIPRNLTLPKPGERLSYEVYIINDPLYDDVLEAKVHDEFAEYYKILPNVPTTQRLKMKMEVLNQEPERGSARTPCMPVVVGDGG
ncbi:MAG TPA: hypothetical protein VJS17_07080, partial [Pyrinomonadaceae bacterium]|nr:hypothetical protein [Pyrinomonadaceae bacterium]